MESLSLLEQISAFDTWSLILCVFLTTYFVASGLASLVFVITIASFAASMEFPKAYIFVPKKSDALILAIGFMVLVSNAYITTPDSIVRKVNNSIESSCGTDTETLATQSSRLEALRIQMRLANTICPIEIQS